MFPLLQKGIPQPDLKSSVSERKFLVNNSSKGHGSRDGSLHGTLYYTLQGHLLGRGSYFGFGHRREYNFLNKRELPKRHDRFTKVNIGTISSFL